MATHKLRVLVVDDQPLTTWAVATALTSRGHEALTAGTRDEACARLFRERFDVVVMSCRLEERDMSDVIRHLTRDPSATRLVVLCDDDDTMPPPDVARRGVVMAKPFDLATLLAAVDLAGGGAEAASDGRAGAP